MKKVVLQMSYADSRPSPLEDIATHDMQRCLAALQKNWPTHSFELTKHHEMRCLDLVVNVSELSPVRDFELFAKGFMASAFLWER